MCCRVEHSAAGLLYCMQMGLLALTAYLHMHAIPHHMLKGGQGKIHLICLIRASHFALALLQLLLSCCRLQLQSSVAFGGLQEVIHKLLGQRRTAVVQRISVVQRLQLALQLRECVCIHGLVLGPWARPELITIRRAALLTV